MDYTVKTAESRFGAPMNPCPMCGSYNMATRAPIQMNLSRDDDAKTTVKKWAKANWDGSAYLEGPVYIVCQDCFHRGPAVDCSGKRSCEVMGDREIYAKMRDLWNGQKTEKREEK